MLKITNDNIVARCWAASRCVRYIATDSGKSGWSKDSLKEHCVDIRLGNGTTMSFQTGHMARFTGGAVTLTHNDNAVLSTLVAKPRDNEEDPGPSFPTMDLQMSVEFRQSAAAMGRIPTNYFRREMHMNDQDIITSRIIDRSLRPTFYPQYSVPTQIICKPLALDETGDSAVMGVNVASAALAVSPVPTRCTVAAARVAIIDGNFAINPSLEQLKAATMNMVLSGTGTPEFRRVIMIDMDGREIQSDLFLESIHLGMEEISRVAAGICRLAAAVNKPKFSIVESTAKNEYLNLCLEFCHDRVVEIFNDHSHDKFSRDNALNEIRVAFVKNYSETYKSRDLHACFTYYTKEVMRSLVLKNGIRCDGRTFTEVRPISTKVDVYKKLHGSAIFQRGQSQVLATVTFDSPQTAFHPDGIAQMLGAQRQKKFMLHYEFPQLAVNELGSGGAANRREIGHGLLAEKALKHVIPEEFPYTIRVAAQVLESNGSTSMAAACAGSLALFDAGVPLRNAVGGIAVGLITTSNEGNVLKAVNDVNNDNPGDENDNREEKEGESDRDVVFLTDLFGMEDFMGDMDFKIAGTSQGFTAMQMDMKTCGLSQSQLRKAVNAGRCGVKYVLKKMNKTLAQPRSSFKPSVPIMETWVLPAHLRCAILFRRGAYNAKLIESETGVQVTPDEENTILLLAPNKEKMEKSKKMIEELLIDKNDIELDFGALYKAEIVEVLDIGVMVTLKKGTRPMLVHNNQLSNKKVGHASALGLEVGSEIIVRYFGRDQNGYHRLSCKMITNPNIAIQNHLSQRKESQDIPS